MMMLPVRTLVDGTVESSSRTGSRRLWLRLALIAILSCAAVPVSLLLRPWTGSNLGIVHGGRVIRAAQPTSGLPALIQDYHLASILNLRGGSPRDWWYNDEVETAKKSQVAFFDLPLSATKRPSRRDLLRLIGTLDRCEYPLLIHCKAGADRTGLATAVYLMMHCNEPPRHALRAFTIYHSHVPLFGTEHLHEPLDEYASWLEAKGLEHTPERFRAWIKNDYHAEDPGVDPPPLEPGPRKVLRETSTSE
jgi:hypothetical protein